ncbi:uncharacterized protein SAPINGB_P001833 [Magnusiomyces paraingens]|uniref:ESCRT-II complex subunit VPS25 n=1 Tax=Magnusiomyces paraingens TaxID=2606893 RepID=A0A5E8BBU3_9ASCO|nr:uncharacterized protein SAPINGB_P001833 [Saprochaete ingens]VVT48549.1 unnamed protein product [Saprochaete ingens]
MEYDDPSLTHSFPFPKIYQFPPFFTRQVNERTWHSQLVNWNSLILAYCRYYRIFTLDLSRTSDTLQAASNLSAPPNTSTTNSSSTNNSNSNSKNKPRGEIDGELFWNRKINRSLQTETIQAIFQYMVLHGNAAWLDQPAPSNNSKSTQSYDDFDNLEYEQQFDRFEQIFNNFSLLGNSNSNNNNNTNNNNKTCILVYWMQPQEWASLISDWVDNTGQNGSVLTLYELVEGETSGSQPFKGLHPAILRAAIDILVQRGKAVIMKGPDGRVAGVKVL